ncbi:MAG: hypothetical protein FWG87_04110 [Defluviitaleaceae bacterium]|nr:hypothetical protein [Defluviitaleaceae bacterium]
MPWGGTPLSGEAVFKGMERGFSRIWRICADSAELVGYRGYVFVRSGFKGMEHGFNGFNGFTRIGTDWLVGKYIAV